MTILNLLEKVHSIDENISLGKPVIVNNSVSFDFINQYNLGILIDTQLDLPNSIKYIIENQDVFNVIVKVLF